MRILDNPIVSIDSTARILEIMKSKVVCKIITNKLGENKFYGTGFFCYIPIGNEKIPVMITCNHIIDNQFLENNESITIEINNNLKKININDKRKIFTNEIYNITIIEINSEKDNITQFLGLDENIFK